MTLPRFSLRLLLLAVAVLCAWLAWERSVVIERRALLAELRADPNFIIASAEEVAGWMLPGHKIASASPLRIMLGDTAIQAIQYRPEADSVRVEKAECLFAEAHVHPARWSAPLPTP